MNKKGIGRLLIHVLAWIIIIAFVSFFVGRDLADKNFLQKYILLWIVHLLIFYINYFLLLPNLIIKKRRVLFLFFIIALLFSGFYINTYIKGIKKPQQNEQRKDQPQKNNQDKRKPPPPPPRPNKQDRADHGTVYGILVFFSLSTGLWFITRWQNNEREKLKFELAYLKQQINPHFLFNALNGIYSLANRKSPKTIELILDLADLLRYMLHDAHKGSIELKKEIEYLNNYIEIEKLRITDKTEIKFEYGETVSDYMIEPMLLFPVVENAFKYGANNFDESFIHINLKENNQYLVFNCKNRIVNHKKKNKEDSGIGLENIKRRLNLLYPGNYSLKANEKDKVFEVELIINLEK